MRLSFNAVEKEFVFSCTFEDRTIPLKAGFSFDKERKHFHTYSHTVAARLREYADERAKKEINRLLLDFTPWSGRVPYPANLDAEPFQLDAVQFALDRNRSYLFMAPGTGKTIVAALIINALPGTAFTYVCPAYLIPNVRFEFEKWLNHKYLPVQIVPDSLLHKNDVWAGAVLLKSFRQVSCLIIDEAHRFKNPTSLRTRALYEKYVPLFDKVVHMSGTMIPNRLMEAYPVLSHCAPETIDFASQHEYGVKYCEARRDQYGWQYPGSTHTIEWEKRTKPFIHSVPKSVLGLKPLTEEILILADNLPPNLQALDESTLKHHSPEKAASIPQGEISTYRRLLGVSKVKLSLPVIQSLLEDTDENVLVFAIHKEVIANLAFALQKWHPLLVTGDVKPRDRFAIAKEFEKNKNYRLVILNLKAGGEGLNFQKATRVELVEFSWVPGENRQAIDRAHRRGQKNPVHARYHIYKNSFDRRVMESNFTKKKAINQI